MYQAKTTQNHLLELSSELHNGSLSLKDLYFDGLIVNYLNGEDIDAEESNFAGDVTAKVASFAFVQNVMAKIKAGTFDASLEEFNIDEVEVADGFEATAPFIGVSQLSPSTNFKPLVGQTGNSNNTTTLGGFTPIGQVQPNNSLYQFHSTAIDQQDTVVETGNAKLQAQTTDLQTNGELESQVLAKTKSRSDYMFWLLAFFVFAVPILWSVSKVFNSTDNSSFSTIAAVEQQNTLVASQQNVDGSANYKPTPLTDGVKYISLQVTRAPLATDLTLSTEQATNINIILYNFEIQKRLSE